MKFGTFVFRWMETFKHKNFNIGHDTWFISHTESYSMSHTGKVWLVSYFKCIPYRIKDSHSIHYQISPQQYLDKTSDQHFSRFFALLQRWIFLLILPPQAEILFSRIFLKNLSASPLTFTDSLWIFTWWISSFRNFSFLFLNFS